MPVCCWPCRSRKARSESAHSATPLPSPAKPPGPRKPPLIKVSEAPEYGNGNPRNKCALQPGHSLMDWIRLGNSGRDMAGTGGLVRPVTPRELAAHNQQGNAWIAIRGRVYNISEYMDYHPGGPDELMRGAGKDATQLFDQVHAWVNYESLLSKCLIGPLKNSDVSEEELHNMIFGDAKASPKIQDKQKTPQILRKSMESLKSSSENRSQGKDSNSFNQLNEGDCVNKSSSESSLNVNESKSSDMTFSNSSTIKVTDINIVVSDNTSSRSDEFSMSRFKYPTLTLTKAESTKFGVPENDSDDKSELSLKKAMPKFDWIQKTDSITLIFYTKPLCNAQCSVSLTKDDSHSLLIKLSYDICSYQFDIILENLIIWPCTVAVNHETGKFEIILQKEISKIWNSYGLTKSSQVLEQFTIINENSLQYTILDKLNINHNTSLLLLKCLKDEYITFPIGYHSRIFYCIEDSLSRSYTVVPSCLLPEFKPTKWTPDVICLMVKKYEQGAASTWLMSREINDEITISRSLGNFQLTMVQDASQFCLIAAGTGLTPMLSIIQFALQRRNPRCKRIDLLFFNRSEKDILWHDQLAAMSIKDNRFNLTNTLSDPSSTWEGQRGHINQAVLINHFSKVYHEDLEVSSSDSSPKKNNVDRLLKALQKELFFCICGPTAFTTLTKTLLSGLGCQDEQVHCFVG